MDTAAAMVLDTFPGARVVTEWDPRPVKLNAVVLLAPTFDPLIHPACREWVELLEGLCSAVGLPLANRTGAKTTLREVLACSPAGVVIGDQAGVDVWRGGGNVRPSLSLGRASGRIGTWLGGIAVMPLNLELVASAGRALKADARDALEVFRAVVRGECSPLDHLEIGCVGAGCGRWVETFDDQGMGWCEGHG